MFSVLCASCDTALIAKCVHLCDTALIAKYEWFISHHLMGSFELHGAKGNKKKAIH